MAAQKDNLRIREVWEDNLEEELAIIREIVDLFPYVAMDTEFPGVVARPVGQFKTMGEYQYASLRHNVDMLKLIQVGLTFMDDEGCLPCVGPNNAVVPAGSGSGAMFCVWQFNFRGFSTREDAFARDSIELLRASGIDFNALEDRGIDVHHFGELLMVSGVVLNDNCRWLTFHSGYDFGYLVKLLTCQSLPEREAEFMDLLRLFFPRIYDMKYLMKFCNHSNGGLHGGLNKLAEQMDVERIGPQHQAGSDALLTAYTFRALRQAYFESTIDKYVGVLYGLGTDGESEAAPESAR